MSLHWHDDEDDIRPHWIDQWERDHPVPASVVGVVALALWLIILALFVVVFG